MVLVNVSEPLINIVNVEEPNALIGSGQKACSWDSRLHIGGRERHATGEKAEPNPLVSLMWNRVSPYRRQATGR